MRPINIRRKLEKVFTENIFLKFISLFTAIVLWVIVSGERDTEWAYLIPLELKNIPKDIIVTNNVPEFLDVRIQGARSFMMEIKPQEMEVEMNMAGLKLGSNIFPVTSKLIRVQRGVKVTRINPSYITVETEKLLRKTVEIRGEVKGKPAVDFIVKSMDVMPPQIEISGSESEVRNLKALKTAVVDITGIKGDIRKEVPIEKGGRKLTLSRDEPVTVMVRVEELTEKLELKDIKVKIFNGKANTRVTPSKVSILLEGPKSLIEYVKKERVVDAAVDARGLAAGKHTVKVDINLPEGVKVLHCHTKEATLNIPK